MAIPLDTKVSLRYQSISRIGSPPNVLGSYYPMTVEVEVSISTLGFPTIGVPWKESLYAVIRNSQTNNIETPL